MKDIHNIYTSANSYTEREDAQLAGVGASSPPRRGRFIGLIASITSPRELHASWYGKKDVEGVAETQEVEGDIGAVAELPGGYETGMGAPVELGARSPAEMEGRRW